MATTETTASPGSDGPLTIVLADHQSQDRAAARPVLSDAGFEILAEVVNAQAAIAAVHRFMPSVCTVEISLPGGGITVLERLSSEVPEVPLVVLTDSRSDTDLFDALRAGAAGYLLKDMNLQRLPVALRGAIDGEAALPRALATRLAEEFRARGRRKRLSLPGRRDVHLTTREWDVLEFMDQGLTTKEIADRLFVAPVTVRTHVSAILKKLSVEDRAAVLRLLEQR
jgi:two-component system NarL family response regulator